MNRQIINTLILTFVLTWSGLVFSDNNQCDSMFSEEETKIEFDLDEISKDTTSELSSFSRFKKFKGVTGKSSYIYRGLTAESSQLFNPHIDYIYPVTKSIVGIEMSIRRWFQLTSEGIMKHLAFILKDRAGKLMFAEIYKVLNLLKTDRPEEFELFIQKIEEFVMRDWLGIKYNRDLVKKSDPKLGVDDPAMERLYYSMRYLNILQDLTKDIFKIIMKSTGVKQYLLETGVEEVAILMSCMKLVVLLYYDYYFSDTLISSCTGVVISDRILLTAAHCIYKSDKVLYYHNGDTIESDSIDYPSDYIGDSKIIINPEDLENSSITRDIGIAIFPKGTFEDIPPATIYLGTPKIGEEVITSGFRLYHSMLRFGIGRLAGNKYILGVFPKEDEIVVRSGESGGALFDNKDRIVGTTFGTIVDDITGNLVNMYSSTLANKEYLLNLKSKYEGIHIEEN